MPIRQDDNQPNRRFGIINLVLIGFGVLLPLIRVKQFTALSHRKCRTSFLKRFQVILIAMK